ncbi:iron-hydroxamate ABC transporter substrate-binding protein [Barrientosiimonas marina]|uniref:Iron-hydroxamate ABC transporter substrate-binding protein n=1 Tax=Lentibacillus kimchii TaxID=1542911 RepID=A0ABW2URL8_9BACI
MKKILALCLLLTALLLSACSETSDDDNQKDKAMDKDQDDKAMRTYESEDGPVEVPKDPERIVVLTSFFAGDVAALDGDIVGVDQGAKKSPVLKDKVKDAEVVSAENVEKILNLDPDLIIGLSSVKNSDKLEEIAPTVTYTYGELGYLDQRIEIGKLLGKKDQAKEWVQDFKKRAEDLGEKVKNNIGADTTISVTEKFDKQFYVYGDNWARGTEILYQAMDLKMPENVKESAEEQGYLSISPEAIPDYAGDYMVIAEDPGADNAFQDTETYKNIPAVKNDHVIHVNANAFHFNDAISLDYELNVFKEAFLGES